MKRIVFCLSNDILYDRRIQRCARSLSKHYEVHILCRHIHSEDINEIGFSTSRIKCVFNTGFLFYFELNLRLFIKLWRNEADYVVAVDYDTILAASSHSRLKKSKLVFDAHEYFEESIELIDRPIVQSFWKRLGKFGVRQVDLAYTVSETIASQYTKIHKLPFHCIRNVPEHSSHPRVGQVKKLIIYQGALNQGRKLELLIDSAKYLNEDYEIWLLGEGDLTEDLKSRAKKIDSNCKIKFHSWVPPDKLSHYTSQAYLAYNLLENSSMSYYYSLANKFFDYLHAGVVSLNSAFPEYAKLNVQYNCCLLVDFTTGQELAEFILDLEQKPEILESLQRNALLAAKELCWEKESIKLLELYKALEKA